MVDVLLLGEWSVSWFIGLVLLMVLYIITVKYFSQKTNYKQLLLFFLCLTLTYLIFGSPVASVVHLSFSLHMIQMSIIYFLIPPLFLLSAPQCIIWQVRKISEFKKGSKYLPSPTVALILFAVLFLFYHLPFTLKLLSYYPLAHNVYFVCLFFLALFMWWPVTVSDSGWRMSKIRKKRYVFLSGLLIMPACMLFIITGLTNGMNNPFLDEMSGSLCLPASADSFALLPPPFNTKYDQIAAGVFMMGLHKFGLMLTVKLATIL